jgi:hypothetical protein
LTLVADAHVHIYPVHDPSAVFRFATSNLGGLAAGAGADATRALFLTERSDCRAFAELSSGRMRPAGCHVQATSDPLTLRVECAQGALYLIAGRQMATRERLEVLALGLAEPLPDGLSLLETIAAAQSAGALAVIPWSPGKWLFGRGRALARLVDSADPGRLLLADSSLRPRGTPEPGLFARARARGMRVIAGSDPLPLPGEERVVGSYAVVCQGLFDAERPAFSARSLLCDAPVRAGNRRSLPSVLYRLARLALSRRLR